MSYIVRWTTFSVNQTRSDEAEYGEEKDAEKALLDLYDHTHLWMDR